MTGDIGKQKSLENSYEDALERQVQDELRALLAQLPVKILHGSISESDLRALDYRHWHVESLLNQAADLLDRCVANKTLADDYWVKDALQRLDILSDDLAQQLSDQEVQDRANSSHIDEALARAAELDSVTLNAVWGHPQNDIGGMSQYEIIRNGWKCAAEYTQNTTGREGAWTGMVRNDRARELMTFHLDKNTRTRAIEQAKLELKRDGHRRTGLSEIRKLKRDLVNNAEVLDYGSKVDRILQYQLKPDFTDAWQRSVVAAKGLSEIYGRLESPMPVFQIGDPTIVEQLHEWVQDAIRWLVKFSQLDQTWTAVYSIRQLVGEKNWAKGLSKPFKFQLPADDFKQYRCVRLRGVTAVARTKSSNGLWRAEVRVPTSAAIAHVQPTNYHEEPINQQDIPSCRIGRIEDRTSNRIPEIAGMISLMNASPISDPASADVDARSWSIEIASIDQPGVPSVQLDDLLLELCLTGRPA